MRKTFLVVFQHSCLEGHLMIENMVYCIKYVGFIQRKYNGYHIALSGH